VKLRDVGEFGLIARIARRAQRKGRAGAGVVLGIGDDAAVLRLRGGEDLVSSCDAAVENVHFRWRTASPRIIGRRAFVAAVSDLAAMGARPIGWTLAIAAPPALDLARVQGCVDGMLAEATAVACPLVGGNVTRARETSFTLCVLGAAKRGRALRRDGARPGDRVFVTGVLGRAAFERARAEQGGARERYVPPSRLGAGRALSGLRGVGACIDLSDGLLADLRHVLSASGTAAEIDPARLPLPRGFVRACARLGRNPLRLALGGGEDYELLFTLGSSAPGVSALERRLGAPVTEIGRIVAGRGVRGLAARGFTHF